MSDFKNRSNFLTFIYGQLIVTEQILTIKAFYYDLHISFCPPPPPPPPHQKKMLGSIVLKDGKN